MNIYWNVRAKEIATVAITWDSFSLVHRKDEANINFYY